MQPLSIGDTLPELTFSPLLNAGDTRSLSSSRLRGRLVILDFFGIWCGSCRAALPRLDSLQRQFGDRLQIIAVDNEPASKVNAFIKNYPPGALSIPFIADDTLLNHLFPHLSIPHEVWIDAAGRVIAITAGELVNAGNIGRALKGSLGSLPLKRDLMVFDSDKTLFENGPAEVMQALRFRSLLSNHLSGWGSRTGIPKDSLHQRRYYINHSIPELYALALQPNGHTTVLECRDSGRFLYDGSGSRVEWKIRNTYCYEITAPASLPEETLRRYMVQDLDRCFGLWGRLEYRMLPCWALIRHPGSRIRSEGLKSMHAHDGHGSLKVLHGKPLSVLVETVNYSASALRLRPPLLDETGFSAPMDLDLPIRNFHDIPALKTALIPYGLDIIPVQRRQLALVISDTSSPSTARPVMPITH